jgi:hypothetical protein
MWSFVAAITLSLEIGCQKRETQYAMENRAGKHLAGLLGMYDALENPRPTNLAQVYETFRSPYPYDWHKSFRRFGKQAGFENSFFEKYIFLPAGVTNRWIPGEIVMMNARPFEANRKQKHRGVFSKIGSQYGWNSLSEERIQQLLRDAGISEPKPMSMSPPPAEPIDEFSREFPPESLVTRISNVIIFWGTSVGLSSSSAVVFRHIIFFSPFVLLPLLGFWLWRRSQR